MNTIIVLLKLFVSNKSDEDMYNRFMDRIYNEINVHMNLI